MRLAALISSALLLAMPSWVQAQAGLHLTAPAAHGESEGATQTAALEVPQPPGAASRLSSRAQPRWPSSAPRGVDPEILVLRGPGAATGYEASRPPTQEDAQPGADQGPTFGASLGHAAAGFGIGTAAGGLAGGLITLAACGGDGFCAVLGLAGAGFGGIVLAPVGAALGTWGFGELSGGTGNGFAALGGAYLGAGLGAGLSALLTASNEGLWAATLAPAIGIVLSMLGAAGGYQLTSHGRRTAAASDSPRTIAMPTLSPTEDGQGAAVGAVGTF